MSFEFIMRVYWEDTDAGGIVYHANYLKYFERTRTEWLRALDISQSKLREETGGMFVVSETSLRYLRPARLDDEICVSARVTAAGTASLNILQEARHVRDGTLLTTGAIRLGWVDAATLLPTRIPPAVIQALEGPAS